MYSLKLLWLRCREAATQFHMDYDHYKLLIWDKYMGASILIPTPQKIWKILTGKILQNSLFHSETYFFDIRSFLILKNAAEWYKNYLIPSVERPEQARNVISIDFSASWKSQLLSAPIKTPRQPFRALMPSYGLSIDPTWSILTSYLPPLIRAVPEPSWNNLDST